MRRVAILAAICLLASAPSPARAWSSPDAAAAHYGYTIVRAEISPHLGWANHTDRELVIDDDLTGDLYLKVGYHEVGHARWEVTIKPRPGVAASWWRTIRTLYHGTAQSVEEDYAESYAYCIGAPRLGVSYTWHPDRAEPPDPDECATI